MLAHAQPALHDWPRPSLNLYGVPGLFDMPTAHAMADADASFTLSGLHKTSRNTFHFQIAPRVSGTFRYSYIDNYVGLGAFYDRSFDLRYLLAEETPRRPAITVGLQDFGGTGVYSGEYVVATKTFGRLRATGGIGWGRFGSSGGFSNPLGILVDALETRPTQGVGGQTGQLDAQHWFRGDAALFGGLEYRTTNKLTINLEYSSDAYVNEQTRIGFSPKTQLNIGAKYRLNPATEIGVGYLYGSTLSFQLSHTINPKHRTERTGGRDPAPLPVAHRGSARSLGWTTTESAQQSVTQDAARRFRATGLQLDALELTAHTATVRFRNLSYSLSAQALGRAARALSHALPASIEVFVLVPVSPSGLPTSHIEIQRNDLEELEHAPDATWLSFARARIEEAGPGHGDAQFAPQDARRFTWGFGPYLDFSFFDPASPVRADFGLELSARFEPVDGVVFSGRLKHRISGNRANLPASNSVLPHVRSDAGRYAAADGVRIAHLTGAYYFRPAPEFYGRLTFGYLEEMFGGLSAELLWKPVTSNLALGIEINHVKQRDFDQGFGFQPYNVTTGHASAYWDMGNGFHAQLDAGRYLAGDWGATLSLDREFSNGVKIGAFATFTDVSFSDFGEGSFDKGIKLDLPVSWLTGTATRTRRTRVIRPVSRDGGARLDVQGRLYEDIRATHKAGLQRSWGRFWR